MLMKVIFRLLSNNMKLKYLLILGFLIGNNKNPSIEWREPAMPIMGKKVDYYLILKNVEY